MKDFGDLEIKTKADLIEGLKERPVKVSIKNALEKEIQETTGVFKDFFKAYNKINNRIILDDGKNSISINLTGNGSGIYHIIELISGKIVYLNLAVLKAYEENKTNPGPLPPPEKQEVASQGYFCYGVSNRLE